MARLTGLLAAAAIVGLTVASVSAQTRAAGLRLTPILQTQQARLTLGSIQGVVSDERGGPLAGRRSFRRWASRPRWPPPMRAAVS